MIEWNDVLVNDAMRIISIAVVCLAIAGVLILVAKQVTSAITGTIGKLWFPIGLGIVAFLAYKILFS